jgi:chromosome segregation ATPase
LNGFLTEIRTFYSLKELRETVEAEIGQYKTLLEDYSQWLGTILRKPSAKNTEWTKKTAELQKLMKTGGRKGTKKEEKNGEISTEWAQFKDIMLCVEDIGEAELLFEAIEELKNKLGKLEKAKTSLVDLERYGLGKDLLYIVFMRDGVPERIYFKVKQGDFADKFQFMADFPVAEQT